MCVAVTPGVQPDWVGSQQRQLGSPYQPLRYQPGFLETKTTSREYRGVRGAHRLSLAACVQECFLLQGGRYERERQGAESM